jgi:hypothetical protein
MTEGRDLSTRPFTYDRSDFVALAELGERRVVRWLFRLAWVVFALAAFLIAICLLAGSRQVLPFVPVLIALLLVYLALHRFGSRLTAWAMGRASRREGLLREQTMSVVEDCFRAESSRGKTEVRWSAIPRVHLNAECLFVFSTRRLVFIIPRRAFDSDEEFDAVASAAQQHWKQHHRL